MISKILLLVYLIISLTLIVYTYIQYKLTYNINNDISFNMNTNIINLLDSLNINVNKIMKIINVINNYFIEISVSLTLLILILILYMFAYIFVPINIIIRILILFMVTILTLYSVYIYIMLKEYINIMDTLLVNQEFIFEQPDDIISSIEKNKLKLQNISKYSIVYIVLSGLVLLMTVGNVIFGF
jgi:hypothetical protein